ncbi:MAG: GNAT family N-acetyltransferase [Lachnospiraceae bacterium]|nr:GNAT family N-acetyltransferase [Lachnospiraceae bacterium]
MEIRKAVPADLERIMEIYAGARTFMAQHGNPDQWGPTGWPPENVIRDDIEQKKCYVCECDGRIAGVFYYNAGERIDPAYDQIDGQWIGSDDYGVVHRIASDGSVRGVGSFCINWAYEQCGHLRMDTHGDNIVMQNLLAKLGFQKCGIVYVAEDNHPRLAYEKVSIT